MDRRRHRGANKQVSNSQSGKSWKWRGWRLRSLIRNVRSLKEITRRRGDAERLSASPPIEEVLEIFVRNHGRLMRMAEVDLIRRSVRIIDFLAASEASLRGTYERAQCGRLQSIGGWMPKAPEVTPTSPALSGSCLLPRQNRLRPVLRARRPSTPTPKAAARAFPSEPAIGNISRPWVVRPTSRTAEEEMTEPSIDELRQGRMKCGAVSSTMLNASGASGFG